jgi:hypothetical protein
MHPEAWLNQEHQFPPGQRLFQSDRGFAVWAYTVSHSQLLLRTRAADGPRTSAKPSLPGFRQMSSRSSWSKQLIY